MPKTVFLDELPEDPRKRPKNYDLAQEVKANPRKWAIYNESSPGHIGKNGVLRGAGVNNARNDKAFQPSKDFQFADRPNKDGKTLTIYVTYVPTEEVPE